MSLSDQHRRYLKDHAITDEVIDAQGIYSDGEHIVFPWRDGDNVTLQRKTFEGEGKYLWESGKDLHFNVLRDLGTGPVLVQEGTKQSLSAFSWAPADLSVYGMAGCNGASKQALKRFRGRKVYVCLDADASTNLGVYTAGENLLNRLKKLRVEVKFLQLPADGSDGMDDFLSELDEGERSDAIRYELDQATDKVADKKPAYRAGRGGNPDDAPDTKGRVLVKVNEDLNDVIPSVLGALKTEWGGTKLFNYGKTITALDGNKTEPLDEGPFIRMVSEVCALYVYTEGDGKKPDHYKPGGRMDGQTIKAVMAAAKEFPELRRVVRIPFVREDGTICDTAGYDQDTMTVLVPDECVQGLGIPETPSAQDAREAASLLLEEWLGDIPFKEGSARANALALILTSFIRGLVGLAPLAVVDGLQAGVGKNLFADCVAILVTGDTCIPMPYSTQDEETRKQITATFRTGQELFVFDEAHVVEGKELARALTAHTWTDRILGVSHMAEFPNRITWMSLGNQVQVNGDCNRRVYWIGIAPKGANPQDRDSDSFRHPDLKGWTKENRGRLVQAALTMIRAWFAAGQPKVSRGKSMGSFEAWDKMLGGILGYAGIEGFLSELQEKRSETDYENGYWSSHINWLYQTFGEDEFTTSEVASKALQRPKEYEAPPSMEDVKADGYSRRLGQNYARKKDRWFDGLKLVQKGSTRMHARKWAVESAGMRVTQGTSTPTPIENNISDAVPGDVTHYVREEREGSPRSPRSPHPSAPALIGLDIETRSVDQLWGPANTSFVRLMGEAYDDDDN